MRARKKTHSRTPLSNRKSRVDDSNETTTTSTTTDASRARRDAQDSLEQSFTPSLARRLSRQFIEQTRQSLPRSPSIPREKSHRSSTEERGAESNDSEARHQLSSTISDQTEYRSRSCDRGVRRTNSLLESGDRADRFDHRSPRRSVSLFDDEDESPLLPPLPRQVMTLGRKYRDPAKPGPSGALRRDSFHSYRAEKIQEESPDEFANSPRSCANGGAGKSLSAASDCCSSSNSNTNLVDTASSISARSCETSPTESSSTLGDFTMPSYKQDTSREFENRLLAAENLIKASKLRNLSPGKFDPNLTSSYRDTDKCDKELLGSMTDISGAFAKRRSCIPSLRLRSGSLTREASASSERRKTLSCSQDSNGSPRGPTPERSILSKFFRAGSSGGGGSSSSSRSENPESKEKSPKPKGQRRISRFLRPDFFDTPREESQYVKDKEAQKAAENERRKSRFTRKKSEGKNSQEVEANVDPVAQQEKPEKELKNEANAITRDKTEAPTKDNKSENEATAVAGQNGDVKFERQSSKSSFLQSLEKKLEKFRSGDETARVTNGAGLAAESKGKSAGENSAPPVECLGNEAATLTRSVEDLTIVDPTASAPKRRVSSVLGLFKNDSSKPSATGQRTSSTLLGKFKRNAYKGSASDSVLSSEPAASTSSKIPTKFAKVDAKTPRKLSEGKKSPEKIPAEPKKSPTTEKSPTERSTTRKSGSAEQQITKTARKVSPEKSPEGKTDRPEKSAKIAEVARKTSSPEKATENKTVASRLAMARKLSPEKTPDNRQTEAKSGEAEEKKIVKTKRNVKSLASLVKNGSVARLEKPEEGEKKTKKVVKSKEAVDKESADGAKKKKIVRVVKKVAKKSDSTDGKSDDKERTTKTLMKRITSNAGKDSSPESSGKSKEKSPESLSGGKDRSPENSSTSKDRSPESSVKIRDKNPETSSKIKDKSPETSSKIKDKSPESLNKINEKSPETLSKINDKIPEAFSKINDKSPDEKLSSFNRVKNLNSPPICAAVVGDSSATTSQIAYKPLKLDATTMKTEIPAQTSDATASKEPESKPNGNIPNNVQSSETDSKHSLSSLGTAKSIRGNLKLDLSKIPQHSFKTASSLKKEFFRTEPSAASTKPKITSLESPRPDESAVKLIDGLAKMTHRSNPTGGKIVIDKSPRAGDVADPQLESTAPDSPREKADEASTDRAKNVQDPEDPKVEHRREKDATNLPPRPTNLPLDSPSKKPSPPRIPKDAPSETDDMFSPVDDAESFDSWSICSADLNHRHDLHSPTSPSYSPSIRGDHPESIVDRIRRKSFYSRFNERKRKSSLNVPPPGASLPTSSTLPRKYSFNSTRDKDYRKPVNSLTSTASRRHPERSYSLYNDETPGYRKSPVDRDRYSELGSLGSFTSDIKSPGDQYGSLGSCYDPLRRYRISPTPEPLLGSQRKYQSTDYGLDGNVGSYRSRLSPSFVNEPGLESYSGRGVLPRKYGSVSSCPEAKTADYYEELLAPTRSDYLSARKTPVPSDYLGRHENGYHNGSFDGSQSEADKWKTYTEKIAGLDLTDGSDGRLDKTMRSSARKDSETRDLPATSTEPDASTTKAE